MNAMPKRPILRYHGGKWEFAPWIISFFPPHRIYTEAFGGAASVLIRKPRSDAEIYNDLDDDTVNLFRVMRDRWTELKVLVENTPFSRAEFFSAYEEQADPIRRALNTIIRSFQGCSPVATTSRSRSGWRNSVHESVGVLPAHNWTTLAENFAALQQRLAGVLIENRAAALVIQKYDAADALHYVDPPYVASTRGKSGAGRAYRHEMIDAEHEELAEVLHRVQGMVVLSGYHSDLYDRLYADWKREEKAATAERGQARVEVLWINPSVQRALNSRDNLLFGASA